MKASNSAVAWRIVREERAEGAVPIYVHPEWAEQFPWLVQGTTARGMGEEPFDLRLFGALPVGTVLERWRALRQATGFPGAVHARQVHGATVATHSRVTPGLLIADDLDGHATREAGLLLTVSVADCIPVFLVDPVRRAIALLHGGWRGVAAGILERGIATLRALSGAEPGELHLHLGPAICGACYEVGPEVYAALGMEVPPGPRPIDLRAIAAERAVAAGVGPDRITVSAFCTRCGDSPFFSHRAGCGERQVGLLGIRPDAAPGRDGG